MNSKITNPKDIKEIQEFRKSIDELDEVLIDLIEKRSKLVYEVGEYKRLHNLEIYDPEREKQIRSKVKTKVKPDSNLTPSEIEKFFISLIDNFRFFEAIHVKKTSGKNIYKECFFDLNSSIHFHFLGFGLIGSSFYQALNDLNPHWKFTIYDPNIDQDSIEQFCDENQFKNLTLVNEINLNEANFLVLAAPIKTNLDYIQKLKTHDKQIVFDLGSTKEEIINLALKSENIKYFFGAHPLAGKELSGFKHGDAMMFFNKTFCWTHHNIKSIPPIIQNTLKAIALSIGSDPIFIDAKEHDKILASSSHVPQLLATAFVQTIEEQNFIDQAKLYPNFSSEIIRIGGSNYSMWDSIIETNRKNIIDFISKLESKISNLKTKISNEESLQKEFQQSNTGYQLFTQNKNRKEL